MLSRVPVTAMRPQQDLKSFLPEMMFNIAFPVFKKNIFLNYFLKVNIITTSIPCIQGRRQLVGDDGADFDTE